MKTKKLKEKQNNKNGLHITKLSKMADGDLPVVIDNKAEKKPSKIKKISKNMLSGLLITCMVFAFNSCATKSKFLLSSVVPAARGYIKVKKDDNKNYLITVHLYNLAEVKRLQPAKQTYVVWMVSDQNITSNIGLVISSTSLFSKSLSGYFQTVSSSKPAKIFITAENDESTQSPGDMIVLSTDRF